MARTKHLICARRYDDALQYAKQSKLEGKIIYIHSAYQLYGLRDEVLICINGWSGLMDYKNIRDNVVYRNIKIKEVKI